jgi:hypothetical protein
VKSALKIRNADFSVEIYMTNHNFLRWATMAIDTNSLLSNSLKRHSKDTLLLTDYLYLIANKSRNEQIPKNAHIILWDGINSYIELVQKIPNIIQRTDLKFFAVGWLKGLMFENKINIMPLYPESIPDSAKNWGNFLSINHAFFVQFSYRALTSMMSYSRYFKNWYADSKRHFELSRGKKIVFCGMVTPKESQLNDFFRDVDLPKLLSASQQLVRLNYFGDELEINRVTIKILDEIRSANPKSSSEFACVYSILNALHRIKTLSILSRMTDALFINETRNNNWIDPYDSFFYKNNLYLDFGSVRGPDGIYPRTLDMIMKEKKYISLRFIKKNQTLYECISSLSPREFLKTCETHARFVMQKNESENSLLSTF